MSGDASPAPTGQLTDAQRMGAACAGGVAVLCFFSWYSVSMGELGGSSLNAFKFTEGIFTFVCALVAAATAPVVSAGVVQLSPRVTALVPLAASAIGLVCMLIFFGSADGGMTMQQFGVSAGRSFWFYLSLPLMGGAGWFAFQHFKSVQMGGDGSGAG